MNHAEAIRIAREARRLDDDTDPYEQPDWVKAHKAAWRRLTGKEKPTGLMPGGRKSRRKPPKAQVGEGRKPQGTRPSVESVAEKLEDQ